MIGALVFDFDGLIFDSELPLYVAWHETFVAHGCEPLTIEEWGAAIGTIDGIDEVALLLERAPRPVDVEAMQATRRALPGYPSTSVRTSSSSTMMAHSLIAGICLRECAHGRRHDLPDY